MSLADQSRTEQAAGQSTAARALRCVGFCCCNWLPHHGSYWLPHHGSYWLPHHGSYWLFHHGSYWLFSLGRILLRSLFGPFLLWSPIQAVQLRIYFERFHISPGVTVACIIQIDINFILKCGRHRHLINRRSLNRHTGWPWCSAQLTLHIFIHKGWYWAWTANKQ